MLPVGFEPTIPASERPQTHTLDRAAFGTGRNDIIIIYRGADKSLARPTSRCILFGGENISFDASLVFYII